MADKEIILESAQKTGVIITAENANIIGGLGGAVSEYLSEVYPTLVIKVGIRDTFGRVGTEAFLRDAYGLTAKQIVETAKNALSRKSVS